MKFMFGSFPMGLRNSQNTHSKKMRSVFLGAFLSFVSLELVTLSSAEAMSTNPVLPPAIVDFGIDWEESSRFSMKDYTFLKTENESFVCAASDRPPGKNFNGGSR